MARAPHLSCITSQVPPNSDSWFLLSDSIPDSGLLILTLGLCYRILPTRTHTLRKLRGGLNPSRICCLWHLSALLSVIALKAP